MGLFFWRRKKTITHTIDGFGDARISVSKPFGGSPRVDIELPRAYVLARMLQDREERLGPTHPETRQAVRMYVAEIRHIPGQEAEVIRLERWLAQFDTMFAGPFADILGIERGRPATTDRSSSNRKRRKRR